MAGKSVRISIFAEGSKRAQAELLATGAAARRMGSDAEHSGDSLDTLARAQRDATNAMGDAGKAAAKLGQDTRGLTDETDNWIDSEGKVRDALGRFAGGARDAGDETEKTGRKVLKFKGTMDGLQKRTGVFTIALGVMAAKATLFAGAIGLAAPGVLHLGAALAPLAGFAGVIPAALFSVGAAAGTLKLALHGVGDAIKAGFGDDPKKAAEELAKLSPSARTFVKSITSMKDELGGLRDVTADAFFEKLSGSIKPLARAYMPMLASAMPNLAGAMGGVATSFVSAASSGKTVGAVSTVMAYTTAAVAKLRTAVAPLVNAFAAVARVGAGEISKFGGGVAALATRFAKFLTAAAEGGKITQWIASAKTAFGQLVGIIGNLGSIFGSVFKSAVGTGGGLLASILGITGGFKDFLKNAGTGGQTLGTIFANIGTLASSVQSAVGSILPVVAAAVGQAVTSLIPAVNAMLPALAQLVVAVTPLLPYFADLAAALVTGLVPAVTALGTWMTGHVGVVKTLATAVLGAVVAYKAYTIYARISAAVTNFDTIAKVKNAAAWVASTAATVKNGAVVAANTAKTVASRVAMAAVRLGLIAWAAAQWLVNVAMTANPIGLIIAGIALLIAAIVWIAVKTTWFQTAWKYTWNAVKAVGIAVWNGIKLAFNTFLAVIKLYIKAWVVAVLGIWRGLQALWTFVVNIWTNVRATFASAVTSMRTLIAGAVSAVLKTWARITGVLTVARNLVTQVVGYFAGLARDVGGRMLRLGSEIINGLKEGISRTKDTIIDAVKNVVDLVPSTIRRMLGIASPSKVTAKLGEAIGQGLIKGMTGTAAQIRAATGKLLTQTRAALSGRGEKLAVSVLARGSSVLIRLAKQEATARARLAAATRTLADLQSKAAEVAANVAGKVRESFSLLPEGEEDAGVGGLIRRYGEAIVAARDFQSNMTLLARKGLGKDVLAQLAGQGPKAAGELARQLAMASADEIRTVNQLSVGLEKTATSVGSTVATSLYGAGIQAAQGLVRGLTSQVKAVEATMLRIARGMQAALRKALGIRSPSKVTTIIGEMVGQGLIDGLQQGARKVQRASARLGTAVESGLTSGIGGTNLTPILAGTPATAGPGVIQVIVHADATTDPVDVGRKIARTLEQYTAATGRTVAT